MSALDDKEVPSADQWRAAVEYMTTSLRKETDKAEEAMRQLEGPTSYYDRYVRWQSQTDQQVRRKAIAEELSKFLAAEPVSYLFVCLFVCHNPFASCLVIDWLALYWALLIGPW